MTRIRRSMARRELGRMALEALNLDLDLVDLEIISVVAQDGCRGNEGEITVGAVAARLSVDPSRASRIVADAVAKGIVKRVASQADARRIGLELTEKGRHAGEAVRAYKWRVFSEAAREWPEDDLIVFARLFERFSGWVADAKKSAGA